METVTKLSERVKHLEANAQTPRATQSQGGHDMGNGRIVLNDPLSRAARIEPGGRIRR